MHPPPPSSHDSSTFLDTQAVSLSRQRQPGHMTRLTTQQRRQRRNWRGGLETNQFRKDQPRRLYTRRREGVVQRRRQRRQFRCYISRDGDGKVPFFVCRWRHKTRVYFPRLRSGFVEFFREDNWIRHNEDPSSTRLGGDSF